MFDSYLIGFTIIILLLFCLLTCGVYEVLFVLMRNHTHIKMTVAYIIIWNYFTQYKWTESFKSATVQFCFDILGLESDM